MLKDKTSEKPKKIQLKYRKKKEEEGRVKNKGII